MTRHYDEPVQVERGWLQTPTGGEGPTHLLWRGRLYRVRDVLGHWVETGAWWRSQTIRALHDGAAPLSEGKRAGSSVAVVDTASDTAFDTMLDTGWEAAERQVWRVEAQAGRSASAIVLDLALDTATGQWTVVRTHD
jgi:hypothetical protein